ncbi:hypothetical protein ACR6EC_23120 [Bacillus subtilis]|uniref:hypothetical protein n=1 Tax=Bacillus subtilis TaxID=1423 RepID=UPI003EBA6097
MENSKKAFYLGLANLVVFIIFLYIHYTTYSVKSVPEFMDQLSQDSSFFVTPLLAFLLTFGLTCFTIYYFFKQGIRALQYGELRDCIISFGIVLLGAILIPTMLNLFLGKFLGIIGGILLFAALGYILFSSSDSYSRPR